MLSNADVQELTEFRRELHRYPEISRQEAGTAARIVTELEALAPDAILRGLGGHGVAAVFEGKCEGPTVLFRAELDALPIEEISTFDWRSDVPGKGHLCGHDGHMCFLLGLGRRLSRAPVSKGRVVLMFQPAEEDGSGARAVVADPAFAQIAPQYAFAIHNEPGIALGQVATRAGLVNCASQGMAIKLSGKTAHAANPEDGTSPALAISDLIPQLDSLGVGGVLDDAFKLVTITHVRIGEPTFGIAPGDAEIFITLRTAQDAPMAELAKQAQEMAQRAAQAHGLKVSFETCDDFAASINDAEAVQIACAALADLGIEVSDGNLPIRASEDFGVFGWKAKAAMLCLGAGAEHAALHNPDYDFPDDLIPLGVNIFERIARDLLG